MPLPLILAPILAMFAKKGLNLVGEAVLSKGKDWVEKKAGIKLSEDMPPEKLMELQKWQSENETLLEKIAQDNLSARHAADMKSDSWLSKNVRPMCLLAITFTIMMGMLWPSDWIDAERFAALTDMSQWVYGYYFIGRSAEKPNFMKLSRKK